MRENRPILIIDDDVDFCCLLQIAFEEAHVTEMTQAIHTGWAAIDHLQECMTVEPLRDLPRLVLLDLRMPGLSGLEVLRWIRSQAALNQVAVVVFTGLEEAKEHSRAIALGATALRVKPFAYRELIKEAAELRDTYVDEGALKNAA